MKVTGKELMKPALMAILNNAIARFNQKTGDFDVRVVGISDDYNSVVLKCKAAQVLSVTVDELFDCMEEQNQEVLN
jgi:hypothetical protein